MPIGLLLAVPVVADQSLCGEGADEALFAAETWDSLGDWVHDHPHCMDGYLAEHVVSVIGEWLTENEPDFRNLVSAIGRHPELEPTVVWYLGGEYHGVEVLERILENTRTKCPPEARDICSGVEEAVLANLRHVASEPRS